MDTEPDAETKAENRILATAMLETFRSSQAHLQTTAIEMAKWIQTTLLAINGAGVIAIFPVSITAGFKIAACASFVSGILLALLCAHLQVRILGKLGVQMGEAAGYWVSVVIDGWRIPEREDVTALQAAADNSVFWPRLLGWSAAAAFLLGCVITGLGAWHENEDRQSVSMPVS